MKFIKNENGSADIIIFFFIILITLTMLFFIRPSITKIINVAFETVNVNENENKNENNVKIYDNVKIKEENLKEEYFVE